MVSTPRSPRWSPVTLVTTATSLRPEAGRGVDLDDRPALLAYWHADVRGDEVDPGDIQADDPGGRLSDLDVVGMGLPSPIDRCAAGRHVARRGEHDALALCRLVVE